MIGYLDEKIVMERLLEKEKNIDRILDALGFPVSTKEKSRSEKLNKLREQAEHFKKQSTTLGSLDPKDIIAFMAWSYSEIPPTDLRKIFGHVENEDKLKIPMGRYFLKDGYRVFEQVPIGKSIADLLAFRPGGSFETIALELKTKVSELKRMFDQGTDYLIGVDRCYLCTTAGCVLDYIKAYVSRPDSPPIQPDLLKEKLKTNGIGLFIVDYTLGKLHKIFEASHNQKVNDTVYNQIKEKCKKERYRPFQDKQVAEDKIWKEQQEKRGCFITTACIKAKGATDNCAELNILRSFRDNYVKNLPYGEHIISEYYKIAPKIVAGIDQIENASEVYLSLYECLVLRSVDFIGLGQKERAYKNYLNIVNELKQKYL